jgi:hypothetical protein
MEIMPGNDEYWPFSGAARASCACRTRMRSKVSAFSAIANVHKLDGP